MATKAARRHPAKAAAAKPASAAVPVPPPLPIAAGNGPGWPIAQEVPVAAAAAVETVVDKISGIREAVSSASFKEKGNKMADTVKNLTAQGEKFVAELKTRAEDTVAKGKAYFADAGPFNKGNIDALVESGKIAAKGFEKLGQDAADYTRRSFEHTTSAFKGFASVKSPTELLKLQSDYVRSSFDLFVAEASRSTEASLKLAGEIAQPISNRFAVAADKAKLAA